MVWTGQASGGPTLKLEGLKGSAANIPAPDTNGCIQGPALFWKKKTVATTQN